jgi:hypothetical protein
LLALASNLSPLSWVLPPASPETGGYDNGAIPEADFTHFVDAFAARVSHPDLLVLADCRSPVIG